MPVSWLNIRCFSFVQSIGGAGAHSHMNQMGGGGTRDGSLIYRQRDELHYLVHLDFITFQYFSSKLHQNTNDLPRHGCITIVVMPRGGGGT